MTISQDLFSEVKKTLNRVLVPIFKMGRLSCQSSSSTLSRSSLCFDAKHYGFHGHCCALRTDLTIGSFLTNQRAYGRREKTAKEGGQEERQKETTPTSCRDLLEDMKEKCSSVSWKTIKFCHLKIVHSAEIYSPLIRGERLKRPQRLG